MKKNIKFSVLAISGFIFTFIPLIIIYLFDAPLLNSQAFSFRDSNGNQLSSTYYPGETEFGIILLEGFGSDQVTMKSLAREFVHNQFHVFTFDFSGHGRSSGKLSFDNAKTDDLANQTITAISEFKKISGLSEENIFLLGHSLGARVALQTATMNSNSLAGLILLGTQVNLSTNVQSEFFTGTNDLDLAWVQSLSEENPETPILMISGEWDDIITPQNAELLLSKLSNGEFIHTGDQYRSNGDLGNMRELIIIPGIVHNYEPFSTKVIREINTWVSNQTQILLIDSPIPSVRIFSWIISLIGIFMLLIGSANMISSRKNFNAKSKFQIIDPKKFLWSKILFWIAALPIAAILGSIFFFIPIAKPVLNLIYVCFIGGNGILLFLLYKKDKVPGVIRTSSIDGQKLDENLVSSAHARKNQFAILPTLIITVVILAITAAYARSGWYYVFPLNLRFVWLIIFLPFTALGFWIGIHESLMFDQQKKKQLLLMVIGLLPFFLYTILMAAIGSLSGMIGGLQGLIILWLVLIFGNLIQKMSAPKWFVAVCMAVLLYWLILPQGVMF